MEFEIKIFKNFDEKLKKIWIEFENQSENYFFQNYDWLNCWHTNFTNKNSLVILNILVYKKNKLLMILPMCIQNTKGINILKWQGENKCDYMAGLFLKNNFIEKKDFLIIWNLIKKALPKFNLIEFKNQPEYIGKIKNPFTNYLNCYADYFTSSITFDENYESFISKNFKKKFLDDTKRRINNLKKNGEMELKIFENEEKIKVTKVIIDQKITRLRSLKQKNIFKDSDKSFYIDCCELRDSNFKIHVSSIEINSEPITYHWGVVFKDTFYHLIPTILDNKYYKFSPGRILLFELIKWSFDNGLKKLDFTIGDESYKKDFSNNHSHLFNYLGCNDFYGIPVYSYLIVKNLLKKILFVKKLYRFITRIIS
tara:strand:+ start:177 stop:1280 length:1104 start_codon:yes stop_codon:yes gene_type:complete